MRGNQNFEKFRCLQNILWSQNILRVSKFLTHKTYMSVLCARSFKVGTHECEKQFSLLRAKCKHYEKTKTVITKRMVNYWRIGYEDGSLSIIETLDPYEFAGNELA